MNENSTERQEKMRLYLTGNLPKPEEEALLNWVKHSPEHLAEFQSFIRLHEHDLETPEETKRAWERLNSRMGRQKGKQLLMIRLVPWTKVAAILIFALMAGFWSVRYWSNKPQAALTELYVSFGERKLINLPDGTKIWLNSGTRFRYPESFSGDLRTVEINGEGFFEVKKDPQHPFVVKTPEFEVKVLGTSFNLSSYKDDNKNSLALLSGSVEITSDANRQKIRLVPGEMATLNKVEKAFVVTPTDTLKIASWLNNTLEFSNICLSDICKSLERQFNVKIEIQTEKLKQLKFSGRIKSDEGLNKILEMLKSISPESMKIRHIVKDNKEEIVIE